MSSVVYTKNQPQVDSELENKDVLWRYIDAAKFLDFLHGQSLFFTRGDRFEDKFEGAFTKSIKEAMESSYQQHKVDFSFEDFKKRVRERVFLNCWHKSADDSMAMWSIYGRSTSAIALTTTVGKLRSTLQELNLPYDIAIKKVKYVKHWRDPTLKLDPVSNVFAYKVKAYDFEKEVRVLIDRFGDEFNPSAFLHGMSIQVSISRLLRSIVIAPEAPRWFLNAVEGVSRKYDISVPIRRSKLTMEPV